MSFKKYFLVLVVLLTIFYLGGQINRNAYDKNHLVALLVLLIFCLIGHFVLKAGIFLRGPVGIILKLLFVYLPPLVLFILMVIMLAGKW